MKLFYLLAVTFLLSFLPAQAHAYLDEFDGLLATHVQSVKKDSIDYNGVNYDDWSMDKRHINVRKALQKMDLKTLKTDEEKLAFWINAYNFFIVDLIIQKGERDSIKDLSGVKSAWDRYQWSVDGKIFTLNDIKNTKLHSLEEPRVHFALSCAAKSCPDLRREAYRPKIIDEQLSDQVKKVLQNKTKGFNVVEGNNVVRVTKIMEWQKEDFNKGNVKSWLHPFFPLFINAVTKITFFDFDWSLNSQ